VKGKENMEIKSKISPCLWFDSEAEAAAKFYTGIFRNSKIVATTYYTEAGKEQHGRKPGSVLTIAFEIEGQTFTALNGGPLFKFNEAISLQVMCDNQQEVDHYWNKLSDNGPVEAQQCGWVKDKFGVSWQVVPRVLLDLLVDPDKGRAERAMAALMEMKKLDIAALERAADGK
jgi:predicted 3-demethylubiquinone-9 3-methyltransferase (glyoxalase superfamily)